MVEELKLHNGHSGTDKAAIAVVHATHKKPTGDCENAASNHLQIQDATATQIASAENHQPGLLELPRSQKLEYPQSLRVL
jgi:hypothetical protein